MNLQTSLLLLAAGLFACTTWHAPTGGEGGVGAGGTPDTGGHPNTGGAGGLGGSNTGGEAQGGHGGIGQGGEGGNPEGGSGGGPPILVVSCDSGAGGAPEACGDGHIDVATGESCEPPSAGLCDANCHVTDCPVGFERGASSGVCYRVLGGVQTADEAFAACKDQAPGIITELATPTNDAELADATTAIEAVATQAWLGARYNETTSAFEWVSCEPWTYGSSLPSEYPWGYQEPNGLPNQACVFLLNGLLWNHPCYLDTFMSNPIVALCEVAGGAP
ncbi:MAG: C-type lectin domain-containing protein [Polyangiaceae bacterium]